MRSFFKDDKFYAFVNQHKNIFFEFHIKRGAHPFLRAIYRNGFEKDIGLRNYKSDMILNEFIRVKDDCKFIIL
jgi:hypothetical protein